MRVSGESASQSPSAEAPAQTTVLDRVLPTQADTWGTHSTRFPSAGLGFFLGGVVPMGLAQRLPEGRLRTVATVGIGVVSVPIGGSIGALIGAGYDLARGVGRAITS
jgi:hypothetical protein